MSRASHINLPTMCAKIACMSNTSHATESERLALPASERLAVPSAGVAKLLNISQRHVANLNTTGRLPRPVRFGRSVRWSVAELRDWLESGAPSREKWEKMRDGGEQ
jgi:predicted DNA-binding transcriptional regulator AlpA